MTRNPIFRIYISVILIAFSATLSGQIKGFNKIKWDTEKIAPGLMWKSAHTIIDDTVLQNFNLLIINPGKREISLIYSPGKNIKTSIQASEANALAAINAGFFNVKEGGSVTYIKVNGMVVDADTAIKWKRVANMNGSLLIDSSGGIQIMREMPNFWFDSHSGFRDVLITGPLLLKDGIKMTLPSTSLVINKHPRSCVGIRNRHRIFLLTVDGRTEQSMGMTLLKLADLMISLGCKDALNLDGGGSTTMWIKGKHYNGVVNMPCDNKIFDHEGERAVADIIIIR